MQNNLVEIENAKASSCVLMIFYLNILLFSILGQIIWSPIFNDLDLGVYPNLEILY